MTNGKGENDETGRKRTERKEEVSEATKEARGCCGRKVARAREEEGRSRKREKRGRRGTRLRDFIGKENGCGANQRQMN